MKLEKHLKKLIEANSIPVFLSEVIEAVGISAFLLAASNHSMSQSNYWRSNSSKSSEKEWHKRAKTIHDVMEDINNTPK